MSDKNNRANEKGMTTYTIDFEPLAQSGQCRADESLMTCARQCGVGISGVCGGQGKCGSCKVQVRSGSISEPTSIELETFSPQELQSGWRLACQSYPRSDCLLSVPSDSMIASQRIQVEGLHSTVSVAPPTRDYHVRLSAPSLSDSQADVDRLLETLNQQHRLHCSGVDIDALRNLSPRIRAQEWECQVSVRGDEVIKIGQWPGQQLGLAIDLGTTTIAGYLVDLRDGRTIATKGLMNPQISYGDDFISRINACISSPDGGEKLQLLVVQAINSLALDLCREAGGAETDDIIEAVVVGNTAMHHIFLGLPVRQLANAPYVPAVCQASDIKARDLGLNIAKGAFVHLLPNIGGFIGADHVAMLLATEFWREKGLVLAIDIGTNTEVSLIDKKRIASVSCASGPAFEGGHIKDGMRAASGAIEHVWMTNESIKYQTIDGAPAAGICGSGILDAVAQLFMAGIIDKSGRMQASHKRVHNRNKRLEFWLVSGEERVGLPPIIISQQDIRAVQLAKAAIRTGIQKLLESSGHSEEELVKVIIAGAFGSYINVNSAVTIGMLPSLPLDRFQQIGNAAGAGARLALISLSKRTEAQSIASGVQYLELANDPGFMDTFVQANYLGRYRTANTEKEQTD